MASQLPDAIRDYLELWKPASILSSMFVCIDHSPSEQISSSTKNISSAILISPEGGHIALADYIAKEICPNTKTLKKWSAGHSKRKAEYHRKFKESFEQNCSKFGVLILGFTSNADAIMQSTKHYVNDLGLGHIYREYTEGSKSWSIIGPYISRMDKTERFLKISTRQSAVGLYVAHTLLRVIQTFHKELYLKFNGQYLVGLWMILSDRPPNAFNGRYAELMSLILLGPPGKFSGCIKWGGAIEASHSNLDLLADNISGLLSDNCEDTKNLFSNKQWPINSKGLFYWEGMES